MTFRITAVAAFFALVCSAGDVFQGRIQTAAALDRQGKYADAGALYDALVRDAENLPSDNALRSEIFNNAAAHAWLTGDLSTADRLYTSARAAYASAHEKNRDKLARILNNVGALYSTQARYRESEAAYREALALKPDSPTILVNLAELARKQQHLREAERLARQALALGDPATRDGDARTLAAVLRDQGDLVQALALYRKAFEYFQQHDIREATIVLANIANVELMNGNAMEAEQDAMAAIDNWKSIGVTDNNLAIAYNNLAQAYKMEQRLAEAEPLYRRALAIWEKAVGPDHPEYARGLGNYADFLHVSGRDYAADRVYERAIAISRTRLGQDAPLTADLVARRTAVLRLLGRNTEADRLAR